MGYYLAAMAVHGKAMAVHGKAMVAIGETGRLNQGCTWGLPETETPGCQWLD